MTALVIENLSVALGGHPVLRDVSLRVSSGECVGLLGPNGAGKSTLLRAALGLIPAQGRSSLRDLAPRERAQAAAWLPQAREIAWEVTVETLVSLGRAPHRHPSMPLSPEDNAAVARALQRTGTEAFSPRIATELSGGEQARVLLARALAQETPLLLADEPIASLDPAHQISTMETFAELAAEGRMVVTALHDLGLAARWCTRLVLLDRGQVVADGPPERVLTAENLAQVYGIAAHIAEGPQGLVVQPLERVSR
ncbi:MAG: ABC transporter ATP-binding protein [Pseudomonadota bacterium]